MILNPYLCYALLYLENFVKTNYTCFESVVGIVAKRVLLFYYLFWFSYICEPLSFWIACDYAKCAIPYRKWLVISSV